MNENFVESDIAYSFAKYIEDTTFEDLPENAVDTAKKSIVDTLGVSVGASGTTSALSGIIMLAKEAGGKPESTIIAFGGKVPCFMAAFVNGAMGHCLDYEDIEYNSTYHPSSAVVPAGFAIAEKIRPVSGRELITAVALGQDIGIRLALSIPAQRKPPWHRSAVIGAFGGTATASKLLKLGKEEIVDAFGATLCQSAGSMELRWSLGHDLGSIYAAFPAKAGVLSALLAQKGVKGIKNCFEGKGGLFNLYFEGKFDRTKAISDLGEIFWGANTSLKPWPSCAGSYTSIDSTLRLMKENNVQPEDIDKLIVYYGDYTQGLCQPLPERQKPVSASDAKYSIPYCVAVAALKGNVEIDDFSASALCDPNTLKMAQRVVPKFDEKLNIDRGLPAGVVEIVTRGGHTFRKQVDKPYGHPTNPLSWEKVKKKFQGCLNHSVKSLPESNGTKVLKLTEKLEDLNDVAEIIELLA